MHRGVLSCVRLGASMRSVHAAHVPLQKSAEKTSARLVSARFIASQSEANKALKSALKSKKEGTIIACLNKIDACGFANDEVYDSLIRRLSKSNQWSALFYVLSHRNTQANAQPYTNAQLEMLIGAYSRAPVVMWKETMAHLQQLLASADVVKAAVVSKAIHVATQTKDHKNILHVWDMLYQNRAKIGWEETILTPLSVAIFNSKNSAKIAELMQLLFESNGVQPSVDVKDVQAVVESLKQAGTIGSMWLPIAVSWLVYHRQIDAALDLFETKAVAYPGDLAAQALVALSKMSQQSDLPAAVPVLFECSEFMLSQPATELTVSSLNSLVQACERLQNYPLAARLVLTGEAQGIQVDESTLVRLGRMLIRAQEYEAALELLQDRFQREETAFSHHAQALLLVCLFRLGRAEAMTTLLDRMFSQQKPAPELVYRIATYGCLWNGMYDSAADLVQVYIDRHDLQPAHAQQKLSSSVLVNGMFACAEGRLQDKALDILRRIDRSKTELTRRDEVKLIEYACRACGGQTPQLLLDVLAEARLRFNDLVPNEQLLLTCAALCCRDGQWEAVPQFLSQIRLHGNEVTPSSFVTLFEFLNDLNEPLALPDNSAGTEGLLDDASRVGESSEHSTSATTVLVDDFVSRLKAVAAQENVDIEQLRGELQAIAQPLM